jgi:hypothetical protein
MVQLILTLAAFSAAACTPAQAISLRSTRASGCARIRGLPVDALDLVGRDYPAIEHAGFIAAAFLVIRAASSWRMPPLPLHVWRRSRALACDPRGEALKHPLRWLAFQRVACR